LLVDLQDEANYSAIITPKAEFANMTLNECILRASKIEDLMTDCSAFNSATASEGIGSLSLCILGLS
jgi:hypothetical protein